jgi:hypothetical protein
MRGIEIRMNGLEKTRPSLGLCKSSPLLKSSPATFLRQHHTLSLNIFLDKTQSTPTTMKTTSLLDFTDLLILAKDL